MQSLLRRKSSSTKTREDKTINIESKIVAERSAAEPLIVTQETGTQVMNFLNEVFAKTFWISQRIKISNHTD